VASAHIRDAVVMGFQVWPSLVAASFVTARCTALCTAGPAGAAALGHAPAALRPVFEEFA
jgi:hypothetical protein